MLALEFMQRALLAALLVGLTAPAVGTFLVQRRLALVGDGIGHVALAGVAAGVLTSTSPVWTALAAAVVGAVLVELLRTRGGTGGDVALAVLFYGGIAGGVVLISFSTTGTPGMLTSYLFGAITTTTWADLLVFAVLAAVVLLTLLVLGSRLYAVSNDQEYARATGMNVLGLNLLLACVTAVTVVVSMRVIGLLLISALMIVPNAVAQQLARSFKGTVVVAVVVGTLTSVAGVFLSFYIDTTSGATIVLLAIATFLLSVLASRLLAAGHARRQARHHPHEHGPGCGHPAVTHDGHVDYLHDGERHAVHGAHYDQH